jgi:aerobic-type carbon monoxide dehydrogenase small subunit (CoxS/CutS family)
MEQTIRFKLNGRQVSLSTDGERPLLWVLRTDLGLTGTKFGCGRSMCGTCTVIIDNDAVRSCQYPVRNVAGKNVTTIEGLAPNGQLHPLQKAFVSHGAVQCGFCTPGMLLKSYELLRKNPSPSRTQILDHMEAHLCRCGTYTRIVDAIQSAAIELKGRKA